MTSKFNKITKLSKNLAKALLNDKLPKSLERSDLFDLSDKDYILDQLTNKESIQKRTELVYTIQKTADWKSLKTKIDLPVRRLYWKYTAVASAFILISLTFFFYTSKKNIEEPIIAKREIVPGTDKAFLTLEDGSHIELEKGKSVQTKNAYSNGEKITYNNTRKEKKESVYNYLTIPRGGQFFITLADDTKVWLNSESQLKYPVRFSDKADRKVELIYGEAYFDVSPSSLHRGAKFKVIHNAQEIEVLGTEFNMKAYQNEDFVYTTLVEGKVAVNVEDTSYDLAPNQQAGLRVSNKTISIQTIDVYHEIAWKNGVFNFKNKSLMNIMRVLARWYEIDVVFDDQALKPMIFSGTLNKKLSIRDVLETITTANGISYELNNKKVLLKINQNNHQNSKP